MSKASRSLRDITKNAINRKQKAPRHSPLKVSQESGLENFTPRHKRRKLTPVLDSSPIQLQSSPSKRVDHDYNNIQIIDDDAISSIEDEDVILPEVHVRRLKPIRRLQNHQPSHGLLERSFGGRSVLDRGRYHDSCVDWRCSTADFYSTSKDVYVCNSASLPFCTTACNSNSLIAIGDEGGGVTLVDACDSDDVEFSKAHISFRSHANAVMDIAFSSDDYLMATASGDQTARVFDMRTQQTRYIMAGHLSSVKQVRFQPGNDSVLATSSRDGSVQIWDLRCRGTTLPVQEMQIADQDASERSNTAAHQVIYADTCISIKDAHSKLQPVGSRKSSADIFSVRTDGLSRRNDVSITAITFMPQGREHLLLSASEANASIKVWDIRGRYTSRKGPAVPVSATAEPHTHMTQRRFGLSSLSLSSDGGRLYSLCRDSTVYAFSTSHLILGHAPEFDRPDYRWRPSGSDGKPGLGPLYGFRHPALQATSFYIKAALRPDRHDREEMLAVGSRDGAPILIPTDERHMSSRTIDPSTAEDQDDSDDEDDIFPRSIFKPSPTSSNALPIYDVGTPLVRGHQKEVTGVTWAHNGSLVSISDDFSARCWHEDAGQAARLRTCGEGEGERWGCGWADVGAEWDEE